MLPPTEKEKYAILLDFARRTAMSNTVMSVYAKKALDLINEPVVFEAKKSS